MANFAVRISEMTMLTFYKLLFQLILSPAQGWSDISYASMPVRRLVSSGLYPLLAVTGLTMLLKGVYHPGSETWTVLIEMAIVDFVKFFVCYYIAVFFFSSYIHRFSDAEPSEKRVHTFVIFSISQLALMNLLENCLPIDLTVIGFLAIYVAVVMLRGVKYMAVRPDKVESFMIFAVCTVIVPCYLLGWLFNVLFF